MRLTILIIELLKISRGQEPQNSLKEHEEHDDHSEFKEWVKKIYRIIIAFLEMCFSTICLKWRNTSTRWWVDKNSSLTLFRRISILINSTWTKGTSSIFLQLLSRKHSVVITVQIQVVSVNTQHGRRREPVRVLKLLWKLFIAQFQQIVEERARKNVLDSYSEFIRYFHAENERFDARLNSLENFG